MARNKKRLKRQDASTTGRATDDGGERPEISSKTKTISPKEQLGATTSGIEGKPVAVQRNHEVRDNNIDKVMTPTVTQHQPSLGLTGGATTHTLRRKSAANLAHAGSIAPLLPHAEQRDAVATGPDRSQSPATRPPEASQQLMLSPSRVPDALANKDRARSAGSEEIRKAAGRRSFLMSARETSWVSRGRKNTLDVSAVSDGQPAGPFLSKAGPTSRRKAAIAGITCIAGVLLFATVIAFMFGGYKPSAQERQLCDTLPCRLHARLLTRHLNKTIDPCEDFSAYMCSAWLPPTDRREHIKTPIDDMAYMRLATFGELLTKGASKFPVAARAVDMHKSCMSAEDYGGAHLPQFRALMQEMGLSWPEPMRGDANALQMLLALSYRWQVHLWFEMFVLARRASGKWLLLFSPSPALPFLLNQYHSVKDRSSYTAYWMAYYSDLSLNATAPVDEAALKATIEEIREMEGTVLVQLAELIFTRIWTPAAFLLQDIGNHSHPITSNTWMNLLQENVALSPQLAATDDVHLSNENLLNIVGGLLDRYQQPRLLSLYGWTFVQMFAPIGEPRMLLWRFGAKHKVNVYRALFCSFHVESTYKALVLSVELAIDNKEEDREAIDAGFQRLVSAAVKKVEGSAWLDDDSTRAAIEKLTSVKMRGWPEEELMKNEALEEIYRDYPSTGTLFVEHWIQARRAMHGASAKLRNMDDSQALWDALMLPSNFPPSYPKFDHALGVLEAPIYMVSTPLYYRGGTRAMFFGGIGYLLAYNLVKAVDKEGVRWLPNGTEVESVLSEEATKAFQERDGCLNLDGFPSVFPELPALEIAYAAMEGDDNGGNVYIGKDISPARAFFMTMCYMSCTVHGFRSSFAADCNKMVRNSAAFASAFDCPAGSKMNPQKKCNFFG